MTNNGETLNAGSDFAAPSDFHTLDQTAIPNTISKPSLVMLKRAHSLEPHDFELESCNADIEMDEGFQAALQLIEESNFTENLTADVFSQQSYVAPAETFDSTSGTDPEHLSIRGPIRVTKPKTKRRHRVSMKQQIDTLHGTVQELTTQLQSLESGALLAKATQGDSYNGQRSGNASSSLLWQQVAARQLERRQEAERDNAELRTMLEQQILEAKNLKRILKHRTRIEMMEEMLGVKRQKMLVNDKPDDLNELRELLRCTDGIYVGVDQKFKEKGMELVPCPGETRHVNSHTINDVILEVLVQQLVPFGKKVTENAVWSALGQIGMQPLQCVKDVNAQVDFYAQNTQETADTMTISYAAAASGFRGSNLQTTRVRKVMRKYVEADRVVFICRMEAQPQHVPGRTGMKQRCDIRVIMEKAETLHVDNDREIMTVIKSHYGISRYVPLNEDYRSYANVDMAIAVWDETISRVTGDIESVLLEGGSLLRETT